jgi:hypothetical protein
MTSFRGPGPWITCLRQHRFHSQGKRFRRRTILKTSPQVYVRSLLARHLFHKPSVHQHPLAALAISYDPDPASRTRCQIVV